MKTYPRLLPLVGSLALAAWLASACNVADDAKDDSGGSGTTGTGTGTGTGDGSTDEAVANPDLEASQIFWKLYRNDGSASGAEATCYFLPRPDQVPAVLVECDTESDMATKLQTYGLCAASVDPAVVNAILCDDALEISTFLNANLYFSSEGPYAGDQLYAEACALDACKDESAVKDFCEYYGDRAAKAKAGEPLPDIARVDTKAELAAIAVCLNELHDVDTSADANAERCTGDAPAPGFRCVEACGGSAVGAEDPKPAWEWLSPAAAKNRAEYGCPICLPAETLIATPKGDTPIRRLRTGDVVWTVDEAGQRAQARIEHADSVETPASHALKRLKLTDGRIVAASPGHPLADGRVFDLIAAGDRVGDGDVKSVELVPFGNSRTYDILPAGPTGLYWAGGVLLKSTLFDARASRRVSADAVTKEVGAPWPKLDAPAD